MPEMDGIQATKIIKEIVPIGCELKIVAVTAYVSFNEKEKCRISNFDGFVTKPIDPSILEKLLEFIR